MSYSGILQAISLVIFVCIAAMIEIPKMLRFVLILVHAEIVFNAYNVDFAPCCFFSAMLTYGLDFLWFMLLFLVAVAAK